MGRLYILIYHCFYQLKSDLVDSVWSLRYSEDIMNQPFVIYCEKKSLFQELLSVSGQD